VAEVEQTAVVRAVEHGDAVASGAVAGELQRHQVGFGARVGEAHLVDRWEALTHELGEPDLVDVGGAEAPPAVERGVDGGCHRAWVVAEEAGRVVAEEVDVLESVDVDEPRPLGARDPERERVEIEHGPRRSAGEHPAGLLEQCLTAGPLGGVPLVRRCEPAIETLVHGAMMHGRRARPLYRDRPASIAADQPRRRLRRS
jgi:hypothetical protein